MRRNRLAGDWGKTATLLCSFLVPALLMLVVLALTGIYPFGEKSLLIVDMNNEYVDYLAQMNESLRTGQSFFRSWNMGMGLNMLGLIAFYTASPFNILVMLFPVKVITEVLFAITLLKIGLAGLLFALYTDYVMDRRGLFAVVFAAAYALCAYNIAYASNIMWLDGVAFLPLVLLGTERLLRENKMGTLLFSLVYVFYTSYYIGFMVGFFALLYFTAVYFSKDRPLRIYWRKLAKFVGVAVWAAGCCCFLLLPAFLNLKTGQSQMFTLSPDFTLERSFVRMASRLLPGGYDSLTDAGYPNIYSSVLGVLLAALFFFHRRISRWEKVVFGGLLAFIGLSFSCRFFYLAWHAFEDPTWFPARFSFVFSFVVLYLAMRAAKDFTGLSPWAVAGAVALLTALFVEVGIQDYPRVSLRSVEAGIVLLLLYAWLWYALARTKWRWPVVAVAVLMCGEIGVTAYQMEQGLDSQFAYTPRHTYTAFREKYSPAVDAVADREGGNAAYRLEIVEQRNANGGMALGYNGISHYSTTTDQALNQFLRQLGYNKGTANELRYTPSTPLTAGMLGIRYVLSEEEMGEGYRLLFSHQSVGVYENQCAFPLAYWVAGDADFEQWLDNPFMLQTRMVQAMAPEVKGQAFLPVQEVTETLHNLDQIEHNGYKEYATRVPGEAAVLEFSAYNPTGHQAYAYLPVWNNKFSPAQVFVDGVEREGDLAYRKNTVLPLGNRAEVSLQLELRKSPARIRDELFYTLDMDLARAAADSAWQSAMVIHKFTDTRVEGTVIAGMGGRLITTFPYDTGWTVWVDGQKVQPETFGGVFLAIPMEAGEHAITMSYITPGFVPGGVISLLSIAGIAVWRWKQRKSTHR